MLEGILGAVAAICQGLVVAPNLHAQAAHWRLPKHNFLVIVIWPIEGNLFSCVPEFKQVILSLMQPEAFAIQKVRLCAILPNVLFRNDTEITSR